jgi:ABC-2 type transport system ATP-binding protein
MEMVADHLVVVGRGRLIADAPVSDVIAAWSRTHVLVHSPDSAKLRERLERMGPSVRVEAVEDVRDDRGVRGAGTAEDVVDGGDTCDGGNFGAERRAGGAGGTRGRGGARGAGLRVFGLGVAEVGDHAHAVGARVHGLRLAEASLEEAYLELAGGAVEYGARSGAAAPERGDAGNAAPVAGNAPGPDGPLRRLGRGGFR